MMHGQVNITFALCSGSALGHRQAHVIFRHIPSFTKSFQKLRTVLKKGCVIFKFGSAIVDEYLFDDTCRM